MERMFKDCCYQSVLLYLDDVIVASATVEQHLERLEEVRVYFWHRGSTTTGTGFGEGAAEHHRGPVWGGSSIPRALTSKPEPVAGG